MRKDSGFEVMDKIVVGISENAKIADIVRKNEAEIKRVVMANEIEYDATEEFNKEWTLNGEGVTIGVRKCQ
jgi:isoleucyl-tRNA synthetase